MKLRNLGNTDFVDFRLVLLGSLIVALGLGIIELKVLSK